MFSVNFLKSYRNDATSFFLVFNIEVRLRQNVFNPWQMNLFGFCWVWFPQLNLQKRWAMPTLR